MFNVELCWLEIAHTAQYDWKLYEFNADNVFISVDTFKLWLQFSVDKMVK